MVVKENKKKKQNKIKNNNNNETKITNKGLLLLRFTWEEIQVKARFVNGSIWGELYCHLARVAPELSGKQFTAISSHDGRGIVRSIIDLEIIVQTLAVALNIESNKTYSNPKVLNRPKNVS